MSGDRGQRRALLPTPGAVPVVPRNEQPQGRRHPLLPTPGPSVGRVPEVQRPRNPSSLNQPGSSNDPFAFWDEQSRTGYSGRGRGRGIRPLPYQRQLPPGIPVDTSGPSSYTKPTSTPSVTSVSRVTPTWSPLDNPETVVSNAIRVECRSGLTVFRHAINCVPAVKGVKVAKVGMRTIEGLPNPKLLSEFCDSVFLPENLAVSLTGVVTLGDQEFRVTVNPYGGEELKNKKAFLSAVFHKVFTKMGFYPMYGAYFKPDQMSSSSKNKQDAFSGFVKAVMETDSGLLLHLNSMSRLVPMDNVLAIMGRVHDSVSPSTRSLKIKEALIGSILFTKHVLLRYRIVDVDFTQNPKSTFSLQSGQSITFEDYFRKKYGLTVTVPDQPLLVCESMKCDRTVLLVPEFCYLSTTRITSSMFKGSGMTPDDKFDSIQELIRRMNGDEKVKKFLSSWGLEISDELCSFPCRKLPKVTLGFKEEERAAPDDWTMLLKNGRFAHTVPLLRWLVVCPQRNAKLVENFVAQLKSCADNSGMIVEMPVLKTITSNSPQTRDYLTLIRSALKFYYNEDKDRSLQLIVVVMNPRREDIYTSVKTLLRFEYKIPSQFIVAGTILRDGTTRKLALKVLTQIVAKIGGWPWEIRIPQNVAFTEEGIMFIGMDACHLIGKRVSILAFVASMNKNASEFRTSLEVLDQGMELWENLHVHMKNALAAWAVKNNGLPKHVVVHRDGTSFARFDTLQVVEIDGMNAVLKGDGRRNIGLCFMCVCKRIKPRFVVKEPGQRKPRNYSNLPQGTVVEQGAVMEGWRNFFLAPQNLKVGTLSPIHVFVLRDDTTLKDEEVKFFTYALCHVYYNWTGPIRVPATLQPAALKQKEAKKANVDEKIDRDSAKKDVRKKEEKQKQGGQKAQGKPVKDGTSDGKEPGAEKSKADLRKERRAIQEAQRAAKELSKPAEKPSTKAKTENKSSPAAASASVSNSETKTTTTGVLSRGKPKVKEASPADVKTKPTSLAAPLALPHLPSPCPEDEIFAHLPVFGGQFHPAVVKFGLQMHRGLLRGSTTRVFGLLHTLSQVLRDY
ncbi:unnamed protein product, partial [Notodromas monacha]